MANNIADTIDAQLLNEIGLVLPQYDKDYIMSIITAQRGTLQCLQQPVTFANLLPLCIDFLLATNQANAPQNTGTALTYSAASVFVPQPWYHQAIDKKENRPTTKDYDTCSNESSQSTSSSSSESSKESLKPLEDKHMKFDFQGRFYQVHDSSSSSESDQSSDNDNDSVVLLNTHRNEVDSKSNISNTLEDVGIPNNPRNCFLKETANDNFYSSMQQKQGIFKETNGIQESHKICTETLYKDALNQILAVVPDVEPNFALTALMTAPPGDVATLANWVVDQLLEKSYPKNTGNPNQLISNVKESGNHEKVGESEVNYFQVVRPVSDLYRTQCLILLQNKFPKLSTKSIRSALASNSFSFAPTVKFLHEKLVEMGTNISTTESPCMSKKSPFLLKFLKNKRSSIQTPSILDCELEKELKFMAKIEREKSEAEDHTLALTLNAQQYEEEGQSIECGCCYGEAPFEDMVQCTEGHLFCAECLKSYAQEAIFGTGKTQLSCMTDGCNSNFLLSQLKKTLPEIAIEKYLERLQDESLRLVELPNLVRCPFCDFAAEIPENDKVFNCQNEKCRKETCRYCKEEWKDHFGIPCNELEKKDQKNLRVSYEEKMSMAKIRTCSKCQCGFMKTDGCNKMTCRCRTTMCYICRKSKIDYNHFCNHPRDPGKKCTTCDKCSLWTDPTEDDERAIKEIQKEAKEETLKLQGSDSAQNHGIKRSINIGPPGNLDGSHKHRNKKTKR